MVDVHFTLRGQLGGRRAELRLERGHIRLQSLTLVSQQAAVDATFPFRELTDLRVIRRVQWTYVIVPLVFVGLIAWQRSASLFAADPMATMVLALSLLVASWLVAWLFPRNVLRIATQGASVELDISTFSRKRAEQLVETVLRERPDLTRDPERS